jgi:hypothetical protein
MNIDKLVEIAEWLEAGAPESHGVVKFGMEVFMDPAYNDRPGCGTVCCIAGAVVQFESEEPFASHWQHQIRQGMKVSDHARQILELSESNADALFLAYDAQDLLGDEADQLEVNPLTLIGAAWAARCIRKLIATGEVDWAGTYVPLPLQP